MGVNLFPTGQCTWYVFSRASAWMPTIVSGGDAHNWITIARAHGLPVGNSPAPGAVMVWQANQGGSGAAGHVAYVESVNPLVVSEMNYLGGNPPGGFNRVDRRAVSAQDAASAQYIYPPGGQGAPSPITSATLGVVNTATAPVSQGIIGDAVSRVLTFVTKLGEVFMGILLVGAGLFILYKHSASGTKVAAGLGDLRSVGVKMARSAL